MFKVGDRVKRICFFNQPEFYFNESSTYIIEEIGLYGIHLQDVPRTNYGYNFDRFKLVSPLVKSKGPYLSNQGTEINV